MTLRDALRVQPGQECDLASIDPQGTPGLPDPHRRQRKSWARDRLDAIGLELASMQERLFATAKSGDSRARVLLVLQAMDCGGKDGTVKKVAGTMNPQGLSIVGFGKPTPQELAHDFLWRIEQAVPGPGRIGVFNRSHYEDVLIARVHDLVPERVWTQRYQQINDFEKRLSEDGVTIIKVMLHISLDEQARRLDERLHDPTKYWKYNPADLDERGFWPAYQQAYADALQRCATDEAPWYVVPANRKWYRDWAVATIVRDTLADMELTYPPADFDVDAERARLTSSR